MSSESAPDFLTFLRELDKKLETAAERLRSNLRDALVPKLLSGELNTTSSGQEVSA